MSGLFTVDPKTDAAMAPALLATAVLAGGLPVRRATRVDPISALKSE